MIKNYRYKNNAEIGNVPKEKSFLGVLSPADKKCTEPPNGNGYIKNKPDAVDPGPSIEKKHGHKHRAGDPEEQPWNRKKIHVWIPVVRLNAADRFWSA